MKKLFTIAFVAMLVNLSAQPFYKYADIGIAVGTSNYSGEIANQSTFTTLTKEFRMQTAINMNYNITRNFSFGAEAVFGKWYANDLNHQNIGGRSFYGESNYMFLGIVYKQRFFGNAGYKLRPFFTSGFGGNFYNTKITGTELSKHVPTAEQFSNNGVAPGITFSLGLTYQASRYIDLGLEAWLGYFGNDEIDNLVYSRKEGDKIGSIRFSLNYRLIR